jgi:hypothetical protein
MERYEEMSRVQKKQILLRLHRPVVFTFIRYGHEARTYSSNME